MKHTAIIIVIGFLFSSCDPVCRAEIKNETKQDILVEVTFDRQELEKAWNGRPYIPFLKSYPNDGSVDEALRFDTINLAKTFRISPGSSFPLVSSIDPFPQYELFRSLQVVRQDTLTFSSKVEISEAFRQVGNGIWVMVVK